MEALEDADAIFCYQAVRRMNEACHIVVEIVREANVGYLDPESGLNSSEIDYKFTPQFAAGALFATSLLDTLVCQVFYNTKILEVLGQLVGQHHSSSSTEGGPSTAQPTSGKCHHLNQTTSLSLAATLTFAGSSKSLSRSLRGSSLYQIPLPEGLDSRTYGALYTLLAKRKMIPLGILRGVFANTKSGPKANVMPYVFTNPPKDTELFSCDKVFVLSQTPIKISRFNKVSASTVRPTTTVMSPQSHLPLLFPSSRMTQRKWRCTPTFARGRRRPKMSSTLSMR
jgi:hypothetical protein